MTPENPIVTASTAGGGSISACAEPVRAALIAAALEAWEDAGIQGLCAEGRFEVVIGAMRSLDLASLPESDDDCRRD